MTGVGVLGAGAPAPAAVAPSREACRTLGNGNLCIRVVPGNQALLSGCYIGQMQDLTDGAQSVTSGGYVCY